MEMKKNELLKKLAPCGLPCFTCAGFEEGIIKKHSIALLRLLESFDDYTEKISEFEPKFKKYPDFKEILVLFSKAECKGCRDGIHKGIPDCSIPSCVKEKNHDFCFECDEFPCERMNSDPHLGEKWIKANRRMREIGAEAYFDEIKDQSHYLI